jgi:hypothetical protein
MSAVDIIGHFNQDRIKQIVPELQRQKATKRDYLAGGPKLAVNAAGDELRVRLIGVQTFRLSASGRTFATWAEAEENADPGEKIEVLTHSESMPLTRTAQRQLCQAAGVPVDTIDRFCKEGQADLAASILDDRLKFPRRGVDPENSREFTGRFLVRTLDKRVRALLSPSYRIMDTVDLFFNAADEFEKSAAEPWQMRLWDDGFQFLAVSKTIRGEVRTDRTFDPGDGWESRWANLGGDTQYAAISITNSETGGGALNVSPAVMTRVCANFCVWAKQYKGIHIQKARENDGLISAETEAAEARVIWLKVRDAIRTVFDPQKFAEYIDKMNGATQDALGAKVEESTKNILSHNNVSEDRQKEILKNLFESRDYSRYGLSQAVTFAAHALDKAGSESDAADMEALGGALIHMPKREFASLLIA